MDHSNIRLFQYVMEGLCRPFLLLVLGLIVVVIIHRINPTEDSVDKNLAPPHSQCLPDFETMGEFVTEESTCICAKGHLILNLGDVESLPVSFQNWLASCNSTLASLTITGYPEIDLPKLALDRIPHFESASISVSLNITDKIDASRTDWSFFKKYSHYINKLRVELYGDCIHNLFYVIRLLPYLEVLVISHPKLCDDTYFLNDCTNVTLNVNHLRNVTIVDITSCPDIFAFIGDCFSSIGQLNIKRSFIGPEVWAEIQKLTLQLSSKGEFRVTSEGNNCNERIKKEHPELQCL